MEGSGSQLDPGFSQQDTPRLIVEDSQPESAGAEDAEQACLGVLARRLPARQSPSPVLVSVRKGDGTGRRGPAWRGSNVICAPALQEIVRSRAGSRAPEGEGAERQRPAGKSCSRGCGAPWGCSRTNGALLAEPMESAARPGAAGTRGRVAEEVPPPGGERRCGGREFGGRHPGARPPPPGFVAL